MLDLLIPDIENTFKMVKNKRDLKSPRRNRSFTGSRTGARLRQSVGGSRSTGNIRVVIRVRPLSERENTNNNRTVIKVIDKNTLIFDPKEDDEPFFYHGVQQKNRDVMKRANKNLNFTFDQVLGDEATNEDVFESSTKSLIETLMQGYNCSVFVYGATGAGKTHTMLGREQDPGITFLTLMELYKQKEELQDEREFEIAMTYLEVYNETVKDLLNPGSALSLREDGKYGVVVAGIKMHRIEESNMLFELLEQGNCNRTQHPTDANAESSRSHAVFQVYLRMKFKSTKEIRVSKLSMIDLAGSERGAATGYSGARFTEGANINKSLLALGNCINSLADGHRHVPYRDSKLTRLLKDSLGGNCQTVMIANVSPSGFNYEDTYNTLKYATRAKKIKSTMKKNVIASESNLNHYMQLSERLAQENEELKLQLALALKGCKDTLPEPETVEKIITAPESPKENLQLQTDIQKFYEEKKQLEHRISQLESTKQLATLRKQLKQVTDLRLSGLCEDSTEKKQNRTRLVSAVDRLDRQTSTIQEEITQLKQRRDVIEARLQEMLVDTPQLKLKSDVLNAEILCMNVNNKADHLQKVCDFQTGELRVRDQMLECTFEVMNPCFLQLRGHGLATEALTAKYQSLIRQLRGVRSVSWDNDSVESDSGISSTTVEQDDETCTSKRKLNHNEELNDTFVISEQPPSTYNAHLKTKVFKTLSDEEHDDVVVSGSYADIPADQCDLHDEVFSTPENKMAVPGAAHKVRAEDMVLRVNKPIVQDGPLPFRSQLQGSTNKTVSAKRLLTNVYKSPARFANGKIGHLAQKENYKPYSRHLSTKSADKDRLKPASARSITSTPSTSSRMNVQNSNFK